ncbi:RNA polymerase sigma factor [Sphingobacterium sp. lm-10]|uniref:RNA polymerase sigma factor n=1 Tax=Sphingobacterium sp. lm-10 TaxID=2944904 RepID=UPI0020223BD7|nr:RNA polymerase sigma factor [Sphingobacterium sp. lm-10]MCL7987221.1 RNA polymerase sigma factor [Sphingobacterium sp. lm-10]
MRKHPPTLRVALEGCVVSDSERSKAYIYKKYYGYVKAVVVRYVKLDIESEEIINESFVKVFRKLSSFEQHTDDEVLEKTFRSWMARIAVNTAIDMLRVKKQMQFIDDEDGVEIGNLSVNMTSSLEANDILKLLDGLPPIQKAIFNLYEIEGYSHEEISKMLDVPESTSRTYLTRAKQKLRMLYGKYMDRENIKS